MAALLLVTPACGGGESAEPGVQPPSFGIIAPEPFLSWGDEDTPADRRFVRITGVYHLPDGNTVIADANQQLRWFDPAGQLIRSVDVQGQSSSHLYTDVVWLKGYRRDSLIAYDAASAQLSVWDANGILGRRFYLETDIPIAFVHPDSPFPDGSLLVVTGPSHVQELSDGWWAVVRLSTFTAEGSPVQNLGTALRHPCRGAVERCAGEFSAYHGTWTAGGKGAYVAKPDGADIRLVTADSTKALKGPDAWAPGYPDQVPTYSRLLVDPRGNLWAQSGDLSRAAVFDHLGALVGVIRVPPELQIYQVGLTFVAGVIEQHNGVERVQIHSLERNVDR